MTKKIWLKSMLLVMSGGVFALAFGLPGGCLDAVVERILTAVAFD